MIPLEWSKSSPEGRIPEEIEKERSSPLTIGVIENGLFLVRIYVELGYENEVRRVRTVNERENDRSLLTSFEALIVTDCNLTNWEGVPEMTPVEVLRDNPIGRDPDEIENESSSPSTVGEIENDSFFGRT